MSDLPSREKVLRQLFWRLMFRGRSLPEASERKRRHMGLGLTLSVYAAFGIFPGLTAFWFQPLAFASSLHTVTLLFAALTLASTIGTMLFVREEADILLHRPVAPAELLRAKCAVIVSFSLLLALALNLVGLVTSFWNRGNAPWFAVAHALTTLLLMLCSASLIVLVYNVCLRWFGRERFQSLVTLLQVLLVIAMIVGGQLMPRLLDNEALQRIDPTRTATLLIPPVWFGAIDMVLCGAMPIEQVWLPAAIGVGLTALLAWLAFVRLGSSYGIGLLALGEAHSATTDRPRRRLLAGMTAMPPLRWWLRDAVERQAFLLTSAYLARDGATKLKVYSSIAPLLVLPVIMVLGPSRRGAARGPDAFLATFALAYASIVPIQALILLERSEQWRTADLFRSAPVPHWAPLFHGARKAVLCWVAVPSILVIGGALAVLRGGASLRMVLPSVLTVVLASWVPGLLRTWLPLARAPEMARESALGCLVFGLVLFAAMGFGAIAAWMHELGLYWPFLGASVLVAVALRAVFAAMVRARRWRPAAS